MNIEKWDNIIGKIKDNFEIEDSGEEYIDEEGGINIKFIVFQGPLGKIRLELVEKPVILDKKTIYSKRIGSDTSIVYVYSETEKTYTLDAYKWNNENWEEIDKNMFI